MTYPLCFIHERRNGQWHWVLKAGNGHQLAESARHYPSPKSAQKAFDRVMTLADEVIDVQVWPW